MEDEVAIDQLVGVVYRCIGVSVWRLLMRARRAADECAP